MHLTLPEWLDFFALNHPQEIDLGLDRIKIVANRLGLLDAKTPAITVSGTNGKGSCVATLESIYVAAGYKVGVFSSPFLFSYTEQIRINQREISATIICDCFTAIYSTCKEISLSGFEFLTLAALQIFQHNNLDVIILEVGMGGKRDAVNIVDPILAIITNVALEHCQWLGNDIETIGREKAGIFRNNIAAVIGEAIPPQSILQIAKELKVKLYLQGVDFSYHANTNNFTFNFQNKTGDIIQIANLPLPKLALTNVANALMAIEILQEKMPVTIDAIKHGIEHINLAGRLQIINQQVLQIFDVAHNPTGMMFLAENCQKIIKQKAGIITRAVFSMLQDKDIKNSILAIHKIVDEWYIAPLKDKRTASATELLQNFAELQITRVKNFSDISTAYSAALHESNSTDVIIICGSFRTVAEALSL